MTFQSESLAAWLLRWYFVAPDGDVGAVEIRAFARRYELAAGDLLPAAVANDQVGRCVVPGVDEVADHLAGGGRNRAGIELELGHGHIDRAGGRLKDAATSSLRPATDGQHRGCESLR